jgi:nucleotide-binding universal stress UspA family protein
VEPDAISLEEAPQRAAIEQIVVGVDFSTHSEDAVSHAIAVARVVGARVALVHVGVVPEEPPVPPSMAITARAYRAVLLQRLGEDRRRLEELRVRWGGQGVDVSHAVIEDMADTGVAAAGRGMSADLVVVGSHGRTGLRRALLGSVAERTVRLADCSVLVARGEAAAGGYRRVVIGTDFSDASNRAIDQALAVAAPDADLLVAHCWDPPAAALDAGPDPDAIADRFRQRGAGGRSVRFDVVDAPPAVGLVTLAEAEGADLLVVGSHGHRGARRLLLGSVAEACVRHARCSVLVAR